jgi:hypothetical protein
MTPEEIKRLEFLAEGIHSKLAQVIKLSQTVAIEVAPVQTGFTRLAFTTTIELLHQQKGGFFRKLFIYPCSSISAAGQMTQANVGSVFVGLRGDGPDVVPDVLAPTDPPLIYSLPEGQRMLIEKVIICGTAADGVFYYYH